MPRPPKGFDTQWVLPYEVVVQVAEVVLERYKRDFKDMNVPVDPYLITPFLTTSKAIKDHLLPLLDPSVTIHTHRQLLSFIRSFSASTVTRITYVTLAVDEAREPETELLRLQTTPVVFRNPFDTHSHEYTEEEVEWRRLREKERDEVIQAVKDAEGRMATLKRGRSGASKRAHSVEGKRVIIKGTSFAAQIVAQLLRFPILECHYYRSQSFSITLGLYTSSTSFSKYLLPGVHTLFWRTHYEDSVQSIATCLTLTSRRITGTNQLKRIELELESPSAADVLPTNNHDPLAFHVTTISVAFAMATLLLSRATVCQASTRWNDAEGQEEVAMKYRHLFCEGQPGAALLGDRQVRRIKFVSCPAGECPYGEGGEAGEAEDE